ncbi:MAG: hypothetical protein DRH90_15165 [Deltaproteobacteria bacterium]|nr:MAG: hypothetical protein DRH90_15165 [Deltaproteobacteria bacterium]
MASIPKTYNVFVAVKDKVGRILKKFFLKPNEAIADDTPPMPMGKFGDSVDSVFEGCFIEILRY